MTQLEIKVNELKELLSEMTNLVRLQLTKCEDAIMHNDHAIALEVMAKEKRVNALELKIDRDCENFIALFNPVAIDLRFILATLKINTNLERIGDNADGIARYIVDLKKPFDSDLVQQYQLAEMFQTAVSMVDDTITALVNEDSKMARKVLDKDEKLNTINRQATTVTLDLIKNAPERADQYLLLLSIIRKLERVGDQTQNIAEEIIFFIEAKVLKHKDKR